MRYWPNTTQPPHRFRRYRRCAPTMTGSATPRRRFRNVETEALDLLAQRTGFTLRRADEITAPVETVYQPVDFEPLQRLLDRRAGGLEDIRDRTFEQHQPFRQAAARDVGAQHLLDDLVAMLLSLLHADHRHQRRAPACGLGDHARLKMIFAYRVEAPRRPLNQSTPTPSQPEKASCACAAARRPYSNCRNAASDFLIARARFRRFSRHRADFRA